MDIVYIYDFFDIDLEEIEKSKRFIGDIPHSKLKNLDFEFKDNLKFVIDIEKKPKKLIIKGNVYTKIILNCDRCLENFQFSVVDEFDYVLFLTKIEIDAKHKEFKLTKDDMEIDFLEENILPLKDIIFGQIYLNIPIKKLCRDNCKGLCPNCGINLNISECNCKIYKEENPFAKLKELLK